MAEIKEYSLKDLQALIDAKDIPAIKKYMQEYNLELDGNKIVPKDKDYYKEKEAYWDLEQYIKKIILNSSYGALLNSNSTFYMYEIGASTTMSGRKIVQHMASKTNEIAIGEYKHKGGIVAYGDTDSKIFNTKQWVNRNGKEIEETVEDLFNSCKSVHIDFETEKEYGFTDDLILSYNNQTGNAEYKPINYVYRHKTSKPKWEIEDEYGHIITVTGDHSCMVERNGKLISVKPKDILDTDYLITIDK